MLSGEAFSKHSKMTLSLNFGFQLFSEEIYLYKNLSENVADIVSLSENREHFEKQINQNKHLTNKILACSCDIPYFYEQIIIPFLSPLFQH